MSETKCLVSSCLVGLCTRYDGCSKPNASCRAFLQAFSCWLPVCPEQLGGLATPRLPASLHGGDGQAVLVSTAQVIRQDGVDVSQQFLAGAQAVLSLAQAQNISIALLKAGSPSCGLQPQLGVTAALLLEHGLQVIEF
jgi:uncharacterized protein YbbK (DUF523 family)